MVLESSFTSKTGQYLLKELEFLENSTTGSKMRQPASNLTATENTRYCVDFLISSTLIFFQ